MKPLIDSCLEDSRFAQGLQQVRAETWAHPGEGAVRTVDYLVQKHQELTRGNGVK